MIGRPITISDELFTIAGVMPREFEFPSSEVEVWTPLRLTPASTIWVQVIARLKNGVGVMQARSAFKIVERQMEQEDPAQRAGLRIDITPWNQSADRK